MTATIQLNGKPAEIAVTVAALIERLDLPNGARGIAVAVNGAVVPRSGWAEATLAPADAVEIIRAMSGG